MLEPSQGLEETQAAGDLRDRSSGSDRLPLEFGFLCVSAAREGTCEMLQSEHGARSKHPLTTGIDQAMEVVGIGVQGLPAAASHRSCVAW